MPFSDEDGALRDIADAVEMIEAFTSGMDFESFREDPKTIAAVERKLQIISEAAIRLGAAAEVRCPDLPWRDISRHRQLAASQVRANRVTGHLQDHTL